MRASLHGAVSLAGALGLWSVTGSLPAALWSVAGGVAIDLDHVLEYVLSRPSRWTPGGFFRFWAAYPLERIYLVFHGAEYILVLGALAAWHVAPAVTGGLAFGLAHHLLCDQACNGVRAGGYSLLARAAWGFRSRRIFLARERRPSRDEP